METLNFQEDEKYLLHATTVLTIFQVGDADLSHAIGNAIGGVNDRELSIIDVAVMKWMRHELYGSHGRDHHASAIIESKKPIEMLRHVGKMYSRGYLKYIDEEIAGVLEKHEFYSDRFIMFTFLEWIIKTRPLSKLKFRLVKKPGRIIIKDRCRAGKVLTEVENSG